ncbi:hypothetical protein BVC80_1831g238 [Macleaya cordata]|uniref:DUF7086 domain-containing protein n=1 Tax=Macleaya cordata TaxID=56857 RepID=A0A200R7I4_MACCD|nr:hypothetical protein BVC80_1831g238 [Macleaya cordata]
MEMTHDKEASSSSSPNNDHEDIRLDLSIAPPSRRQSSRSSDQDDEILNDIIIVAPFEWATTQHATIHSRDYLLSKGINKITGEVQCKKCEHRCNLEFDFQTKFMEIGAYIWAHKVSMCERAPERWRNPKLQICPNCNQPNSLKPIIPSDKTLINWLFLLLGEMLGCCTLEQLKYFCYKNNIHRTGAKDRLLYLTYLALCKQLDPTGPFNR